MSYADLIDNESIDSNFFGIISPKRVQTGFALDSGAIYTVSFPYGQPSVVTQDDTTLTQAASASLSSSEWYFDRTTELLYVRMSDDSNPSTKQVIVTFDLFVSTIGIHHTVDPIDANSQAIFYEPLIKKSPKLKNSLSDTLFGYLPVKTSTITLGDPTDVTNQLSLTKRKIFQRVIFDSSFNKASIKLYHWLSDDLDVANIKLVYDGLCSNITYRLNEVSISIYDRIDEFDEEFRNAGSSYITVSDFPNINPLSIGKPIRYVFGVVDGFIPEGPTDFVDRDSATTSDNRTWICIGEQVNLATINASVTTGNTTTTTVLIGTSLGLRLGDRVHMDRVSGTDDYAEVLGVSEGGGNTTITHKDLTATGGAMTSGDAVRRPFVGWIDIVQDGVRYELYPSRDYTENGSLAGTSSGFTLTNNFEANHSGLTLFTADDQISARIYGRKNDVTITGPISVGSDDTDTNNLTNPVVILLDLFLNFLGLSESKIDTASFITEEANVSDALGFSIPDSSGGGFPTYKELIVLISKSSFLRLFLDDDLKWTIARITDSVTPSKTVMDDELIERSFGYEFNYKEIVSDIVCKYANRELNDSTTSPQQSSSKVTSNSTLATRLHGVNKTLEIETLHFKEADAQAAADRYKYIFGDRLGTLSVSVPRRFFDNLINDTIRFTLNRLPADVEFDFDTLNSKDYVIQSIEKNLKTVDLELDDIKGISENSGSF